jgi:serine protease Do
MRLHFAIGAALAAALVLPAAFAQPAARPYLGIGVRDIDAESARKLNLNEVRGVEVTSIAENSPAAKAGFKQGDIILEYNGQRVEGGEQLSRMVHETPAGRQVRIGVWRGGSMHTLTPTVESRVPPGIPYTGPWSMTGPNGEPLQRMPQFPRGQMAPRQMPDFFPGFPMVPSGSPTLGILGEALGQEKQLADYFGVQEGVLVKAVNHDSAAEKAGIKAGDVIVRIEDTKVTSSRDITMALRSVRDKKTVTVVVVRNRKEMPITVTLDNSPTAKPVRAQAWLQEAPE